MTVEELIKRLQELPQDALVVNYDHHQEVWHDAEVENVNEYYMFEYDSGMYRTAFNSYGEPNNKKNNIKVVTV